MFLISEILKEAGKEANLTQEELQLNPAQKMLYFKSCTKKNIQLSTIIRIFEQGSNRKVGLTLHESLFCVILKKHLPIILEGAFYIM